MSKSTTKTDETTTTTHATPSAEAVLEPHRSQWQVARIEIGDVKVDRGGTVTVERAVADELLKRKDENGHPYLHEVKA